MSLESDALRKMLESVRGAYEKRLKSLEDRVEELERKMFERT